MEKEDFSSSDKNIGFWIKDAPYIFAKNKKVTTEYIYFTLISELFMIKMEYQQFQIQQLV